MELNRKKGVILALIAALFWGYMGVPVKKLTQLGVDSFSISFFRAFLAGIFYISYVGFKKPKSLKIKPNELLFFAFYGLFAFASTFVTYNLAVKFTSISIATVLMFTAPLWVVLFSTLFLKEEFNKFKLIAMISMLFGNLLICKVFFVSFEQLNLLGIFIGVFCGLSFSLQGIFAKISADKFDQDVLIVYAFLIGSFGLFFFCDWQNNLKLLSGINKIEIFSNIIQVSVLNTIIANGAFIKSMKYIEAGFASTIVTLELIVACCFSFFIFNEKLSLDQLIGMLLVTISVLLFQKNKKN